MTTQQDVLLPNLKAYIEMKGWHVAPSASKWLVYIGPDGDDGHPLEIVLPSRPDAPDFPSYLTNAVNLLSVLEEEAPEVIVRRIKYYNGMATAADIEPGRAYCVGEADMQLWYAFPIIEPPERYDGERLPVYGLVTGVPSGVLAAFVLADGRIEPGSTLTRYAAEKGNDLAPMVSARNVGDLVASDKKLPRDFAETLAFDGAVHYFEAVVRLEYPRRGGHRSPALGAMA